MQAQPAQGRVAIVTGAAGGIGKAITQALLDAGHSVSAVDRDGPALEALRALHQEPGRRERLYPILADLADPAQCRRAADDTLARFGRIEAVINNAGIGMSSVRPDAEARYPTIEELTPEIWDKFFAINLRAAILVTRAALPAMKAAKWGRIVNNTTSYLTMLRVLPYGAIKAAFEAVSAVWAKELDGQGITVNVLVPGGPTDTPLISDAAGWPREKMLRPDIMGPPAAWLLSGDSEDFTGQRIIAARWDPALPGREAARKAGRAIGWPELGADAVWLSA